MSNSNLCITCNRPLVLGNSKNRFNIWCPNCEGLEIISTKDAISEINNTYTQKLEELMHYFEDYSKDSIIGTLLVCRETCLYPGPNRNHLDLQGFISYSHLIKEVVGKDKFGKKYFNWEDKNFARLFVNFNETYYSTRLTKLLDCGLCIMVNIPREKLSSFLVEPRKNKLLGLADVSKVNQHQLKFTPEWAPIFRNLETIGLFSELDSINTKKFPNEYSFDDLKHKIAFLISMDMVSPDRDFIKFPEFINQDEYINFLSDLWNESFTPDSNPKEPNFRGSLQKYDFFEFISKSINRKINFDKLIKLITFDETMLNGFPIAYLSLTKRELFVPPRSIHAIYQYLLTKYVLDLGFENSKAGHDFEKESALKLNKIGINTHTPNDCKNELINVVDNTPNATLEIDIIGYTQNTIWVIDCKNFMITTDILDKNRKSKIKGKLENLGIQKKQQRRIEFVKSNLQKFGFSPTKIKHYKSVIITLLEEPLDNIGNSYLIPINKINKIFDVPDYE